MHVCYITHEYPLPGIKHGGVGTLIRMLGRKLVEKGHAVSVVGAGYKNDDHIVDEGVNVFTLKGSRWKMARFIDISRRVNSVLAHINKENPIQIIETPEMGLAFIKRIEKTKRVVRLNGGHHFFTIAEKRPREWWKVVQEKRSIGSADAIVAVSQYVASITKQCLPLPSGVRILYNPVDLSRFYHARQEKTDPHQLLFIGTVCEKKGVRQLIEAMPAVIRKFPDVYLRIVGRDWISPRTGKSYIASLKKSIPPEIDSHIQFYGPVSNDQVPRLLEEAALCVLPSHMEALPLAWLEALAMGKPVVASSEGPGAEVIKDGMTGLLADPYDPKDIAEKIIYMLGHKEEAGKMGMAAREDVFQRFNLEQCISDNITFYENLIKGFKNYA